MVSLLSKRVKYILNLRIDRNFGIGSALISAYCSCLSPEESIELLRASYLSRKDVRYVALKKVCKDVNLAYNKYHSRFVNEILKYFDNFDAQERQSAGYCLSSLLTVLPFSQRRRIQIFFIKSRYTGVRKRGYKSLMTEESVPADFLKQVWKNNFDPECAWLIVNKLPIKYLIENRQKLSEVLTDWQRSRLYIKMSQNNMRLLSELKNIDVISYCYILAKIGKRLSSEEAKNILMNNIIDERRGLLIWSFGKMGLWDVLRFAQDNLSAIEKKILQSMKIPKTEYISSLNKLKKAATN
jgi:hypothetical protein